MKTTHGIAVNALITINKVGQNPMPSFAAYKLFRLKKKLADAADFQTEQETKLVEEMGGKIGERGKIIFDTPDKYIEFAEKQKEIADMEYEVDGEKIEMYMTELPNLSVSDMETLDAFITWKE